MIQQHDVRMNAVQFSKELGDTDSSSPKDELEIMEQILDWLKAHTDISLHTITIEETYDIENKSLGLVFTVFFEGDPELTE